MIFPLLGLGTYKLNGSLCENIVREALSIGYRHIDTADAYGNHQAIGKAIKEIKRDEIFLTTKLFINDLIPSRILDAVPRFLEELEVDYIDLLLIHWPNPEVDLVQTLNTMLSFQTKGMIRFIGVSNFVRFHLEALAMHHFPIFTNQIEMHPYLQRKTLVHTCKEMGIKITAYRPLAKGAFENDPTLQKIGSHYGKTPSQVALRWLIQQEIAAIPKASSLEHLKSNFDVFDFQLTPQDMEAIDALDSGQRFCSPEGFPVYED